MIEAGMSSPEASIQFLREVLRFCEACAARGYVVEGVEAEYSFGPWTIRLSSRSEEASRGIVFSWDGREGRLAIKERVRDDLGLWPLKLIDDLKVDTSTGDDPFTHCLEYLDR
jgi:hypothetical protein